MIPGYGRRCLPAAILVAFLLSPALPSQEGSYDVKGGVDWAAAELRLTVSLDASAAGIRLPAGRSRAQSIVQRDLPDLIRPSVFGLAVDSRRTIADAVESGDISLEDVAGIIEAARPLRTRFSADLRTFSADAEVPLGALASLFIRHQAAFTAPAPLDYRAAKGYTGIVIYADRPLPVSGEDATGALVPCLFPKVWDDRGTLVLERNVADPEAERELGLVAYVTREDPVALEPRVGQAPLRILATGVYGARRTDPVISRDDALRILSSDGNRRLLTECRVVIVYRE